MAVSKKKKGVVEKNQEQLYTSADMNLETARLMSDMEIKFKLYKRTIELLTKITTTYAEDVLLYKGETASDGRKLTEEEKALLAVPAAQEKIEKVQKEYDIVVSKYLDQDFQDAIKKYENAESAAELEEVVRQLENNKRMKKLYLPTKSTLKGKAWTSVRDEQKSIPDIIAACNEKMEGYNKKEKNKQGVVIAIVAVVIAAILFSFTTPLPKLAKANVEEKLGILNKAEGDYKYLYSKYGKSEYHDKYLELRCNRAKNYLEDGDYKKAYDTLEIAVEEDFEGAEELLYQIEMESIINRKLGGSAHFGDYIWHILERTDDEAVLTTRVPIDTDVVFSEKEASWQESDLRTYLNSDFYENSFSEIEKADILLNKVSSEGNAEYGISAGEETEDRVYVLSAEEVTKYSKFTKKQKVPYWLRNPGAEKGLHAFAIKNTPMMYGYKADDSTIAVYPVIRVSLKNYK